MLKNIRIIPQTDESHAFATAVKKCRLQERGYTEEEYIFSGTANVYESPEWVKRTRYADAPYTNRMLLRKPESTADFSGNIVIEILNSTSGFDIDRVWVLCRDQFMRNGDIYIGITSKPNAAEALKRFDPVRYSGISWANPLEYDLIPETIGNLAVSGMPSSLESEDGLFWDMLTDIAKLIRSDSSENPVREYINRSYYTYLSGWSQSGGYMIRYIQDFSDEQLFDGYFSCGSISFCTPSLNQEEPIDPKPETKLLPMLDRPMIEVHTECDNAKWGNIKARVNSETFYRVYDVAGASHDTTCSMEDYYGDDKDLIKIGVNTGFYPGAEKYPNSFPYQYVYNAAFSLLCEWVREGKAPFIQEPISVDPVTCDNLTDDYGNAKGGWRLPVIEYPLCRYCPISTPENPSLALSASLYGHEEPFPECELKEKYGNAADYSELIRKKAEECVSKGLMVKEDVDALANYALKTAVKYGLSLKKQEADN